MAEDAYFGKDEEGGVVSRRKVVPYDRTRRRRHWSLGDPPKTRRRSAGRYLDPRWWLKVAVFAGAAALLIAPYGMDGLNLVFGARAEDGCRVVRVVDGDTVTLWCPNGLGAERARLVGFDAPEKFSPDCASETARALGAEWYLRRLLATGEALRVMGEGRDRYDRRLVRLWIDGEDVARLMIRAGHARAYAGGARGGWCA